MASFALLGPNYVDRVFNSSTELAIDLSNFGYWSTKLGGVFNVARQLKMEGMTDVEITVASQILAQGFWPAELSDYRILQVDDSYLVDVVVIEDTVSATRTALVDKNLLPVVTEVAPNFATSSYLHIAYLDSIKMSREAQRELRDKFEYISCDLASGELSDWALESFWMIDALICSDAEYRTLLKLPQVRNGQIGLPETICVHDPEFLLTIVDGRTERVDQPKYKFANTLGAGDAFVATFLAKIAQGDSEGQAAKLANDSTRQMLRSRGGTNE